MLDHSAGSSPSHRGGLRTRRPSHPSPWPTALPYITIQAPEVTASWRLFPPTHARLDLKLSLPLLIFTIPSTHLHIPKLLGASPTADNAVHLCPRRCRRHTCGRPVHQLHPNLRTGLHLLRCQQRDDLRPDRLYLPVPVGEPERDPDRRHQLRRLGLRRTSRCPYVSYILLERGPKS